jgi:hypothetical protein
MWCNSLRTAVFSAALVEYLSSGSLISLAGVSETLGSEHSRIFNYALTSVALNIFFSVLVKDEWSDRLALPVEDYLHGIISLVNELVSAIHRCTKDLFLPSSPTHSSNAGLLNLDLHIRCDVN